MALVAETRPKTLVDLSHARSGKGSLWENLMKDLEVKN